MVVATQTQFDERNPRYYTCSCFHVRNGVIGLSTAEIVYVALVVIRAFASDPDEYGANPTMDYDKVKWLVIAHAIIKVVCALLAIGGMRGIKPAFLIPSIVMQVISLVVIFLILCISITPSVSIIIEFGLVLVFAMWFLVVFVRGYKYLKDKKEFLVNNQNSFVAGSVPITCCNPPVYAEGLPSPGQPNYAQFGYAKMP